MGMREEIRRGLREFERACNSPSLKWKGANYDCSVSSLRRGTMLSTGGFDAEIQLTILVRKDIMPEPITADTDIVTVDNSTFTVDLDAPPTAGKKVELTQWNRKRAYRVLSVREPAPGSHWEFDLGTINR